MFNARAVKNLVDKASKKEDGMTFFQWFLETDEEDEVAQLIRDEVFHDPLAFFGVDVRCVQSIILCMIR